MMQQEKQCLQCGKTFIKKPTLSQKHWENKTKYCSKECGNKAKIGVPNINSGNFKKGQKVYVNPQNRKHGSENNRWKGGQVTLICKICNKDFKVDRYRSNAKCCSKECSNIYRSNPDVRLEQSERARKQFLAQYQDTPEFITSLSQLIRESAKYRLWREQIWKRDKYTCQTCQKQKGKVCADHIISFLKILLDNKIETYEQAMETEDLWKLENGQTLCYECHYKTDNYGFKAIKEITS